MSDVNNNLMVQKRSVSDRRWWQKRAFNIGAALLGLLLVITVMTINVAKYESHLATGDTVLLELAPVDPRGFMQGDYMTLRYAIENQVLYAISQDPLDTKPSEGYVIVTLNKHRIGRFSRLEDDISDQSKTLTADEMAIHYRLRNGVMQLATNAFFFQEGHAKAFEAAEYGLFRVNDKGEPLLTNMVNGQLEIIQGTNIQDKNPKDEPMIEERPNNTGRQGTGM